MSYKIYGRDEAPMLMIVSDDGWQVFGMSLSSVDPASREWLANLLDERFQEEFVRASKNAVDAHKADMRKLLGFPS